MYFLLGPFNSLKQLFCLVWNQNIFSLIVVVWCEDESSWKNSHVHHPKKHNKSQAIIWVAWVIKNPNFLHLLITNTTTYTIKGEIKSSRTLNFWKVTKIFCFNLFLFSFVSLHHHHHMIWVFRKRKLFRRSTRLLRFERASSKQRGEKYKLYLVSMERSVALWSDCLNRTRDEISLVLVFWLHNSPRIHIGSVRWVTTENLFVSLWRRTKKILNNPLKCW